MELHKYLVILHSYDFYKKKVNIYLKLSHLNIIYLIFLYLKKLIDFAGISQVIGIYTFNFNESDDALNLLFRRFNFVPPKHGL